MTEVPVEVVFQDTSGMTEAAYMLTYIKGDQVDMISTVERDMEKVWVELG